MPKFPNLIHVTEEGDGNDKYFQVSTHGVMEVDEPDTAIAIYQLVKVGTVGIQKRFIEKKR